MPSVDTQWFRGLLAERRMSQRKLAKAMHLDPAALSLLLRGRRNLRLKEAEQLSSLLQIPLGEILAHFGVKALAPNGDTSNIPVIGTVDAEGIVTPHEGEYVERPAELQGRAVVLFGATNQWLYFLHHSELPRLAEAVNRLCMIQVKGEPHSRLVYVRKGLNNKLMIHSNPKDVPVLADIEHAAPVLLIRPL
jgi:transcriptional regulator with XRE-family HTH domain